MQSFELVGAYRELKEHSQQWKAPPDAHPFRTFETKVTSLYIHVNVPEDARESINTGAEHLVIDTKAQSITEELLIWL